MKKLFILPYQSYSKSAKAIRNGIEGAKLIKRTNSRYRYRNHHLVLNWGVAGPGPLNFPILNCPTFVDRASNKLKTLSQLDPEICVPWTQDQAVAALWPKFVVCRHILNGSGGSGIEIHDNRTNNARPSSPLYTQYIMPQRELRIHVFKGEVLDVQFKARKVTVPDDEVDWKVRNHQNGWIYVRNNVFLPPEAVEKAKDVAKYAVDSLGGDFAAVDILVDKSLQPMVLELNTAPGLVETTLRKYIERIELEMST